MIFVGCVGASRLEPLLRKDLSDVVDEVWKRRCGAEESESDVRHSAADVRFTLAPLLGSDQQLESVWAEVLRLEHLYNKGEPFREVAGGKLKPGPGQRGVNRLKQPRTKPATSD